MYSDFTRMAHGNPRLTQVERFRRVSCTSLCTTRRTTRASTAVFGCGTVLAKCPISMNIAKVIKALGEEA